MSKKYGSQRICALPIRLINELLSTDLFPGDVWLSAAAHRHIAEDHPEDYAACFSYLEEIVTDPGWIGQAPQHQSNIELLKRISANVGIALVALCIEPNRFGNYSVRSLYRIKQQDLGYRRRTNRILPVVKKSSPRRD